jgi:hypothetical protein
MNMTHFNKQILGFNCILQLPDRKSETIKIFTRERKDIATAISWGLGWCSG